jgi:hypothetical protein
MGILFFSANIDHRGFDYVGPDQPHQDATTAKQYRVGTIGSSG